MREQTVFFRGKSVQVGVSNWNEPYFPAEGWPFALGAEVLPVGEGEDGLRQAMLDVLFCIEVAWVAQTCIAP